MRAQCDEIDGRIQLSDNAGGGAAILRPISVQCAGVWISVGLLLVLLCIWPNAWATQLWLALDVPHRKYCFNSGCFCIYPATRLINPETSETL